MKILFIFSLCLFVSFRGYVGYDWTNYIENFKWAPNILKTDNQDVQNFVSGWGIEPGFKLLTVLIKTFTNNYLIYQTFLSFIDIFVLYGFFKYYVPKYWILSFLVFFIFGGLNYSIIYLRNVKSLLCFLVSIRYFRERKYSYYYLLNVLGLFFHLSSLFYLLFGWILGLKFNKRLVLMLVLIGLFLRIINISFSKNVIHLMLPVMPGRIAWMIQGYLDMFSKNYGLRLGDIERFFSFFLVFNYSKNNNETDRIFINAYYIYYLIYLYCFDFPIIVGRVSQLFIFSYWILYPRIYASYSRKKRIYLLMFLFFFGLLKTYQGTVYNAWYYDNYLFSHYEETERRAMYLKVGNSLKFE